MIGISEAVCTDVQGALPVENKECVGTSGGNETGDLFAALLAGLSGGLLVAQSDLEVAVQGAAQDAQIDVAVEGAGAVGTVASLSGGVPLPLVEGCADEGGVPSTDAALTDVAHAAVSGETSASVTNSAVESVENVADSPNVSSASGETLADIANAAGNAQEPLSENAANTTGTGEDQAAAVPVQDADRLVPLEFAPDPDASSRPEVPMQVNYSAESGKANYAAAEANKAAARASPAGAKLMAPGEGSAELATGAQPVLSSETKEAPSHLGFARVAAHARGDDNGSMVPRHDAQPGGNDLARGSGEKLLPENLVHSHGPGAQRAVDATGNALWRVSDVARANLTEPVMEQTVRGVLLSVRDGASELRVRIQPEHLGELHLRLVFKDNVLNLNLNAQSTVVKSIIESNLGQLRQSLHSNGVDVGKVSVTVDPDISSGGHFSREAPVFQPSEGEWAGTYRGDREEQEPPLEQWFRGARLRHAVNRLDLVA